MVLSCSAFGCCTRFNKESCITFHSFPSDPLRRKIWIRQIRRKDFVPSKYSKLCSKHFTPDCFETEKFGGTWLKSDAVPTIFDFSTVKLKGKKTLKKRTKKKEKKKNKDSKGKKLYSTTETSSFNNDNNGFGITGRRIVNINYFIHQLMQLNEHGPSGCSLNYMNIISETRRGLESELKFKCSMCNFEKCIWTDDISRHSPASYSAAFTEIRNGYSAAEEFLDVLNIPSVSTNTYTAEHDKVTEETDQNVRKAVGQLGMEKEDADSEGFTAIVKCSRTKRTDESLTSDSNLEKSPEIELDSESNLIFGLEPNLQIRTVTTSDMTVELDPRSLITPDVDLPDLSVPGPSSRMEPDCVMMKQGVDLAMTCEIYPADSPRLDSHSKIKEEPIDPDPYEQGILSVRVAREQNSFSNESSRKSNQRNYLFQSPVLIKKEQIYLEES